MIEKAQLTLENVILENVKIVFFDIRTMFDANGQIKRFSDWDENIGAAVSSIEVEELYEENGNDRIKIDQTKKN